MTDPVTILTLSIATLAGLAMLITASLAGWRGWLDLQRQALGAGSVGGGDHADRVGSPPAAARIEIADLKERIRKLEAIAAGIDL
ncbi:MAG: hypothetical protein JWO65_1440 [Sphingomonas bacterium]|jgi:hypothetical protein|nr:hypothetical protein [Sphingomonas bacterium]